MFTPNATSRARRAAPERHVVAPATIQRQEVTDASSARQPHAHAEWRRIGHYAAPPFDLGVRSLKHRSGCPQSRLRDSRHPETGCRAADRSPGSLQDGQLRCNRGRRPECAHRTPPGKRSPARLERHERVRGRGGIAGRAFDGSSTRQLQGRGRIRPAMTTRLCLHADHGERAQTTEPYPAAVLGLSDGVPRRRNRRRQHRPRRAPTLLS